MKTLIYCLSIVLNTWERDGSLGREDKKIQTEFVSLWSPLNRQTLTWAPRDRDNHPLTLSVTSCDPHMVICDPHDSLDNCHDLLLRCASRSDRRWKNCHVMRPAYSGHATRIRTMRPAYCTMRPACSAERCHAARIPRMRPAWHCFYNVFTNALSPTQCMSRFSTLMIMSHIIKCFHAVIRL